MRVRVSDNIVGGGDAAALRKKDSPANRSAVHASDEIAVFGTLADYSFGARRRF